MFQFDQYSAGDLQEANRDVRLVGEVLPDVLARYGLSDALPEPEVEPAEAELVSA